MHGRDIRPLLDDPETSTWQASMLLTHTSRSYGSATNTLSSRDELLVTVGVPWYVLLRDVKYKYVRYLLAGEMEELYDLEHNPEELTNLARQPN